MRKKWIALLIALLSLCIVPAATLCYDYLTVDTTPVKNIFVPDATQPAAANELPEENTLDQAGMINPLETDAYIRVKLDSSADFIPGENWVLYEGYYYYTLSVSSGEAPTAALTGNDGDVTPEFMATDEVAETWGVVISPDSVMALNEGGTEE